MNIYNISNGQLITLWISGIILWFVDLGYAADSYSPSALATFSLVLIPSLVLFYTIGWRNFHKSKSLGSILKSLWARIINLYKWKKSISELSDQEIKPILQNITEEKQTPPRLGAVKFLCILALLQILIPLFQLPLFVNTNASLARFWCIFYVLFVILNIWLVLRAFSALKHSKPNTVALLKIMTLCLAVGVFVSDVFTRILNNFAESETAKSTINNEKTTGMLILFFIVFFIYLFVSGKMRHAFPTRERKTYMTEKMLFILILLIPLAMYYLPSLDKKYDLGIIVTKKAQTSWVKFDSPDGNFSVDFPSYPKTNKENLTREDLAIIQKTTYRSSTEYATYTAGFATYPDEIQFQEPFNVLHESLNSISSQQGSELISSNPSILNGNEAIDFLVRNKQQNIYMKGKIILSGKNLYMLVSAATITNEQFNDQDDRKFIDSFELKNPAIEKLLQEIPPPDQLRQKLQ